MAQQDIDIEEDELELLELALAQSCDALNNLEEVMLQWMTNSESRYCRLPLTRSS